MNAENKKSNIYGKETTLIELDTQMLRIIFPNVEVNSFSVETYLQL